MRTMGNTAHAHSSLWQAWIHPSPQTCCLTNQQGAVQSRTRCFLSKALAEEFCLHISLWDCEVEHSINAKAAGSCHADLTQGSASALFSQTTLHEQLSSKWWLLGVGLHHSWALQLDNLSQTQEKKSTSKFGPHHQLLNSTEALPYHISPKKKKKKSRKFTSYTVLKRAIPPFPSMHSLLSHWNPK